MREFCFILYFHLRNSTEQDPFWEANSSSTRQKILRILCNPKSSSSRSQQLATCPIPGQINEVQTTELIIRGAFKSNRDFWVYKIK
jgi:hypothetical protein